MSEFNIYARKLDTAFKEARSEYNTAFRALQEAQQASRDANAWKPGDSAEEKQVRTARAALAYFIQTISAEISAYIGFSTLMLQIGATMGILAILLICYFISTWIIFRRSVNP